MDKETQAERSYEPPRVVFHSKAEILRAVGPAAGCARWSINSLYSDSDNLPTVPTHHT